jgi:lipoprotein-anchoring transpeptidase ErfK/SrfK
MPSVGLVRVSERRSITRPSVTPLFGRPVCERIRTSKRGALCLPFWLVLRGFFVTLLALSAFGAAVPAAGVPLSRIAPGVTVGGVEVGGLTSESARARIAARFDAPLRFYLGERTWTVSPAELGANAGVKAAVVNALQARARSTLPLPVGVRVKEVRRYVERLDRKYRQPAVEARLIGLRDLAPAFTEARNGRRVDRPLLVRQILKALRSTFRAIQLPIPFVAVKPDVTSSDYGPIVVIRRGSNKLYLYDGARLRQSFGVATGSAKYPTPLGEWEIVTMQRNPWWIPPDSKWAEDAKPIPPGPGNPLGTRWMGLDATAVGIHGTPDAASIGYSASHGCIRMRIPDAEALFSTVEVGTPVYVVSA